MKMRLPVLIMAALSAPAINHAADWLSWRGPLQTGVSVETYEASADMKAGKVLAETPAWTYDSQSRGCPVICDGKVFAFGYLGVKEELVEVLTCLDEKSGKKLWEVQIKDYISDTVYNRYAIGAPVVDPTTKRVYLLTAYGVFGCWDFEGKEQWRISMMEKFGRMTFPNSKVGAPAIEGDYVIVRGITANWGGDGPPADRFYAFDKITGEQIYVSTPGESPPQDSSFSHPIFANIDGKRVYFAATGCGNIVCANALTGKPLWRHKFAKAGANATVLIDQKAGVAVAIHGDENLDTADKGRMLGVKLPTKFNAPLPPIATNPYPDQIVFDPAIDAAAWKANEVWRHPFSSGSGSPILVDGVAIQITDTGSVVAVDVASGEVKWNTKVGAGNTHSSPAYADGYVFAPIMDDGLNVLDVKTGKLIQQIKVEGQCIGAACIANGNVYVHTLEKLYQFKINASSFKDGEVPATAPIAKGKPAALQVIPAEVVVFPGEKVAVKVRQVDAAGNVVGESKTVKWETFIPVTAKVRAEIKDAAFNDNNELVANADAKLGAGAFKCVDPTVKNAKGDPIFGTVRARVMLKPPFTADFNQYELTETFAAETVNPEYKFAYPPLPWIGARFKFQVMDKDGEKVFGKSFDRLLFQRGTVFIGTADMSNYTVEADVMTDGNRRSKSDVGLINQRYAFVLKGNANELEISSNYDRFKRVKEMKIEANKWYTMKTQVKVDADGVNGTVMAKVWEKGQPEPAEWTLSEKTNPVHTEGSPGIFGFTPQNQKRIFIDNVKVTPNN
ncbi:MAG: PQQ-binding-like beta-propeller repeat protein [Verrucomicrobiaceae bacterium]|nr:PQQ-binding-like beta-propeller repeat protein [Verrucomicrobiaceae bacterium]